MKTYDILIIGGGPTGSTAATLLSRMGYSVLVLEKEFFPREHVGESLIPATYHILKRLNVLNELNKIAPRKPGVHFVGADGINQSLWCFNEVIKDESYLSYHVKRSEFDQLLLNNSKKNDATVMEGLAATSVNFEGPDGNVIVETSNKENFKQDFCARFLLDASGQNTFLGNKLRTKKSTPGLDRVAIFTHWSGCDYDPLLNEGVIKIVYLGGEKVGWSWVIPISAGNLSIGIVMNNAFLKQGKAKYLETGKIDWKTALYMQEIRSSAALTTIVNKGTICHNVQVIGDYSYTCEKKYGLNYAIIGDAGAFLDPIFSSGIFVGMRSAEMVADAIDELFKNNNRSLFTEAYQKIDGAITVIEKFIRIFYSRKINFAEMGDTSAQLEFKNIDNIYGLFHFLLSGDFFESHHKYSKFLDIMQNDKSIAKFLNLVDHLNPHICISSCGEKFEKIFGALIAEISFMEAQLP